MPAGEPLLEPHLRVPTCARSPSARAATCACSRPGRADGAEAGDLGGTDAGEISIGIGDERISLRPSFSQSHNLRNLLAAVAAARALGVTPEGELDVAFSALRGERVALADGIVLINDCYNANPMSMRAALDDLAASAPARRVAVLGDMLELGSERGAVCTARSPPTRASAASSCC